MAASKTVPLYSLSADAGLFAEYAKVISSRTNTAYYHTAAEPSATMSAAMVTIGDFACSSLWQIYTPARGIVLVGGDTI